MGTYLEPYPPIKLLDPSLMTFNYVTTKLMATKIDRELTLGGRFGMQMFKLSPTLVIDWFTIKQLRKPTDQNKLII